MNKCFVVTILLCDHMDLTKESPNGCCECDMLNWWSAFKTEEECNQAFMKQYPEQFENGK